MKYFAFSFFLLLFCFGGVLALVKDAQAQVCNIGVRSGSCISENDTCPSGITAKDVVHCSGVQVCCGLSADRCSDTAGKSCQSASACVTGSSIGVKDCTGGQVCCTTVSSGTNTCSSSCGTNGTCSCTASASCVSPKITVSAGNSYCSAQTAGNVCCKTMNSSGGGTTTEEKCKDGFEEYAGVCFPTNTGLSKLGIIDIAVNLMKWMLYLFGFLAIISFVVSGIQYLAASGNASMIETAKRNMTYSIVGVIVALAGLIIITAIDALLKGTAWGG